MAIASRKAKIFQSSVIATNGLGKWLNLLPDTGKKSRRGIPQLRLVLANCPPQQRSAASQPRVSMIGTEYLTASGVFFARTRLITRRCNYVVSYVGNSRTHCGIIWSNDKKTFHHTKNHWQVLFLLISDNFLKHPRTSKRMFLSIRR